MVKVHWSEYKPYDTEVVRYVAPIGDQYYIMELERFDTNWYEDDVVIEWNLYQCIVDQTDDKTIYTVSEEESTGRTPLETYHVAMKALRELLRFMRETYEVGVDCDNSYHHIHVIAADGQRGRIYDKMLTRFGWDRCVWDELPAYRTIVKGTV